MATGEDDLEPILIENLYAPPIAPVGIAKGSSGDLAIDPIRAEQIRVAHLGHESAVKSVGAFYYLLALLSGIGVILSLLVVAGLIDSFMPSQDMDPRLRAVFLLVFYLVTAAVFGVLGYGLRSLHVWARWTVLIFMIMGLLITLLTGLAIAVINDASIGAIVIVIGSLIEGFVIYLLVAGKAAVVFSDEYKQVTALTPQVRYRTSRFVQVFVVLLGILLLLLAVEAYIGG